MPVDHLGTGQGHRHYLTNLNILGAANNLQRLCTIFDASPGQSYFVGVGVRVNFHDFTGHDRTFQVDAEDGDFFHFKGAHG